MQKLASDMNKSRRQSFIDARSLTGIADTVRQATCYNKMFKGGCCRLTHGRTRTLPVNHATAGLRHGSFKATRT
jgi:hypothetical protein